MKNQKEEIESGQEAVVRKPPHQLVQHSSCPAANSSREPCKPTHPGPEILLRPHIQQGGSVLPTPCWQKEKKKLNGSCRMPHAGCSEGAEKLAEEMLNFSPCSIPLGYCCILTRYFPALKPRPGVSKHHNLHVLQDGRKSLPLALFLDMRVKAASCHRSPPSHSQQQETTSQHN